jgi:hypothetical protein
VKKRTVAPSEYDEQVKLIDWCNENASQHPELSLIFSIPNESSRNTVSGCKLNKAGRKKGVPDLFLPVARHGYHGLFIELKRSINATVSEAQIATIKALREQRYVATVCYGCDEAIALISRYLS